MNPRLKKIGRNILFMLAVPAIIGAFVFANSNTQDQKLSGVHIDIENTELSFVTEDDILNMIANNQVIVNETVINDVQVNRVEASIKENKWVSNAEIFITANHEIHVKVKQKIPVVRINQTDSIDYAYYLDDYANPIELSEQYIAKVPVVTAPRLGYSREDLKLKNDLVQLAHYIQRDTFWNAMVSQINVDNRKQIELIPTLGHHLILLGTIDNLSNKMKRLLSFYQNGIQTIDWNRYNEIDARFEHQVVARNTQVSELINKTIEKAKIEEAKAQREKYLLALQRKPKANTKSTASNKH